MDSEDDACCARPPCGHAITIAAQDASGLRSWLRVGMRRTGPCGSKSTEVQDLVRGTRAARNDFVSCTLQ